MRFEPPLVPQKGDLGRFIASRWPGARAVAIEYLDAGVVNSNYRVELAGEPVPGGEPPPDVVRLRLSRSDDGPRREGALAERWADRLGLPIPRLLATEPGSEPEPHRRSLFEWISGPTLAEWWPRHARGDQSAGEAFADSLAALLAALHSVTPAAFGRLGVDGEPIDRGLGWAEEMRRRVTPRLANPAHGMPAERVERLREQFGRLLDGVAAAGPIRPALVHGDLSPENIVVDDRASEPRVAGLLDWEMARAADPALDLASLRFEWVGDWAPLAEQVAAAYRRRLSERGEATPGAGWSRRVALAGLPALLDARMVAHRRAARQASAALDSVLDAALAEAGR